MRRSPATALAAFALAALTLAAQAPSPFSYDFRAVTGDDSHVMTGTVRVNGGRARIDVTSHKGDADDDGEFLLVSGDGQVLTVVRPRERSYSVYNADTFARIATIGVGAVAKAITMKLRQSSFQTTHLGPGDRIAGRATERVRMIEQWRMDVGAFGFTTPVTERVETEYSFDPTLTLARNPLLEVIQSAPTVLPSTDAHYAARGDSLRHTLLRGTPLRTVITHQAGDGKVSRTVLEVTRLARDRVDDAELQVPAGYTRKDGGLQGLKVKL